MTQKEFDELLLRYRNEQTTSEENKIVDKWFQSMIEQNSELLDEADARKLKLWNKLDKHIEGSRKGKIISFNWDIAMISRVAAIIVFVSTVIFFAVDRFGENNDATPALTHQYQNTKGSIQEIKLADGSIVWLEPGSTLGHSDFTDQKREVHLVGEAFFEVARDESRPFFVVSGDVVTKVLGTSFRVTSYPHQENVSVVVKTGRVSVTAKVRDNSGDEKQQEIIITPNQQVIYDRTREQVTQALVEDPEIIEAEPSLKMRYTNVPAIRIFEDMKKTYGINIQFDPNVLSGCTVTVDLSGESLYESLDIVCHTIRAGYEIGATAISIQSDGCNTPNVQP